MNDEEIIKRFEEIEKRLNKVESIIAKTPEKLDEININENIWDIEGNNLTLLKTFGEKIRDKTKNTALLVLLGYKIKLGKEKILASDLRRSVAIHKIPLENFATYLNELIPQSIIRNGKIGSIKSEYKLTTYGEALARNLLKQISSQDEQTN